MKDSSQNLRPDKVAVCSWSLQPTGVDDLLSKLHLCQIQRVQIALQPLLAPQPDWSHLSSRLASAHIHLVSGMMGCVGEDYKTIPRIRETGGVIPDATWPATLASMKLAAPVAAELNLSLVTFHAGFIPTDTSAVQFQKGLQRVREVANIFAAHGISVALETGQEPATALTAFLSALYHPRVGVNFDPANMLLYGSGDPIAALRLLLPHIRQVHIKDAVPSGLPDVWGKEVPPGQGAVDWPSFFSLLNSAHFDGHFVIEREAGGQRSTDVIAAAELVRKHTTPH